MRPGYRSLLSKTVAALTILGVTTPIYPQTDWFPPQFREGAAQQLVSRLTEIGVEFTTSEEERLDGARQTIGDLVSRIDGWGVDGVLERAPALEKVDLPPIEDRLVRTIALFGACSLPLHPELVETTNEKIYVALGEISVVVVSAFLRNRFLAAGGTDEQLATQLNSDVMNQLSYDIQVSEEMRNYVAAECGPTFAALFGDS